MFENFLAHFEREFDCKAHVLRTDGGGEYRNVDLFCQSTGVARQVSEAKNQVSNGKAERMHRTVLNMARCMIFASGLALHFWGDVVQYAAYILNRIPTNANPNRVSPLEMLTGVKPQLSDIVVFGSACTAYRDPGKKEWKPRAQVGMIVGMDDETNGYKVYLPHERDVVVTQHREEVAQRKEQQGGKSKRTRRGKRAGKKSKRSAKVDDQVVGDGDQAVEPLQPAQPEPSRMRTRNMGRKHAPVTCGSKQQYGVDYTDTFSAALEMLSCRILIALSRRLRGPARHGDVPNAYVTTEKEPDMKILLHVPQGMKIETAMHERIGVTDQKHVALRLIKSLYRLKQAGRWWANVEKFFSDMSVLNAKNLGTVSKFLGMAISYNEERVYMLEQRQTIKELLQRFGLADSNSVRAPVSDDQGGGDDGSLLWDAWCTRPDIAFAVHRVTRRSHAPREADWRRAKRIARYLKGTIDLKLRLEGARATPIEAGVRIEGYSDADYAADREDLKSVSGGMLYMDDMIIGWFCKKQTSVALSTMDAEFVAGSLVASELLGPCELLRERDVAVQQPMMLHVGN
ncbi:unnamed protein product [Phytophthora fragariaefolia]|uniref:Unnamed protein product n=1 Tax=Phytophthora fragariaefolia TaxID=1490495 RepID=A0A9W7CQY9_9STRA|nr:unnamed protein product [Phytophthora fragariaefolia]